MKNKIESLFILLTFFFFSLGQLGRISFSGQEVNLYIYELLMTATFAIIFFRYRLKPVTTVYKRYRLSFLFVFCLLISYVVNIFSYTPMQNLVALMYLARLLLYFIYALYLGYYLKKEKDMAVVRYGFFIFIVVTSVFSFAQYFWYPDLRNLIYLGWDSHFERMFGVFLDTSVASAIYGMIFFIVLSFSNRFTGNKLFRYALLLLFGLFLIMSFARSAYIAFLITLFIYFLQQKKAWLIIFGISIFILLLLVVPKRFGPGVGLGRTFSIDARIVDITDGINMWLKNPVLGIGYNRIRYARKKYHILPRTLPQDFASHAGASFSSSYLIMLVSGGIIGLILFILSLVQLGQKTSQTQLLFVFIGLLSLTDNIFLHPFILFLLGSAYVLSISYFFGSSR